MYGDDMLLTPLETMKQEDPNMNPSEFFISFLNRLEGWKQSVKTCIGQHLRKIYMYILMNF